MYRSDFHDWADEAEQRLLDIAIRLAGRRGWNGNLVREAAKEAGLSEREVELLLPMGARDLAALFVRRHDDIALERLGKIDIAQLKIRERIQAAVETRIEVAMEDESATRACRRFLALPLHMPLGLRLGWETADKLWRWAGDEATDENHYTKRVILAAIIASTQIAWMIAGRDKAREHLAHRIDEVMKFEKWKITGAPNLAEFGRRLAERFAHLRYGPPSADEPRPEA